MTNPAITQDMIDGVRVFLTEERSRLVRQLDEIGATDQGELRSDVEFGDGGFADSGAATAERTEVLGVAETLAQQVAAIEAAIEQIDQGTYGICVDCGDAIPAVRLEARPASIRCVACKSKR